LSLVIAKILAEEAAGAVEIGRIQEAPRCNAADARSDKARDAGCSPLNDSAGGQALV